MTAATIERLKKAENDLHEHIRTCKTCVIKSKQETCAKFLVLEEAAIKAWRKTERPNPLKS